MINGDSLYIDSVEQAAGGLGNGVSIIINLHGNTPVKIDYVGTNSGHTSYFSIACYCV